MERAACTRRDVLLEVRADVEMHHAAGLVGRRAARHRSAMLATVRRALGEDLDRPLTPDELWALHEGACALVGDRRTAESVRGVVGRHLLETVTAGDGTPGAPAARSFATDDPAGAPPRVGADAPADPAVRAPAA
jgi:hypothetical protein